MHWRCRVPDGGPRPERGIQLSDLVTGVITDEFLETHGAPLRAQARFLIASVRMLSSSNIMVAPTNTVAPPWSKGAETSTTSQTANHLLRLERGHAVNFRRIGIGCEGWVEHVDIEADVGRPIADHAQGFGECRLDAYVGELLHVDHADAALLGESIVIGGVDGTANADLHGATRVQQALLDGPAGSGTALAP
jgi:hypothetical protein